MRVIGHSSGEIAAAYCAGALTQDSALSIAYHRGAVAQKLETLKDGAMLAVGLSEEALKPLVANLTQGTVKVACVNSFTSTTVSGDRLAVLELLAILQERSIFARPLSVKVAYHSHHSGDVTNEYQKALGEIRANDESPVLFYSSVTGQEINLLHLNADYWVSNLINSVKFLDSVQSLLLSTDRVSTGGQDSALSVDALVEIGPHSALQGPIGEILRGHPNQKASRIPYMAAPRA